MLERGDERELDALALLVAGSWRGGSVLDHEGLVGVGLEPDRLDERALRSVVRVACRAVVDPQDTLRPALDHLQARVGRDPVEPGAKEPAVEPRQPAPRPQERLLEGILGVGCRAQHPVAVCL
jgi:hypothetical protein